MALLKGVLSFIKTDTIKIYLILAYFALGKDIVFISFTYILLVRLHGDTQEYRKIFQTFKYNYYLLKSSLIRSRP